MVMMVKTVDELHETPFHSFRKSTQTDTSIAHALALDRFRLTSIPSTSTGATGAATMRFLRERQALLVFVGSLFFFSHNRVIL